MTAKARASTLAPVAMESPTRERPLAPLAQALIEALAPGGVVELDPELPERYWSQALVGPALAFLDRPGKDLRARLVLGGWRLAGKPATTLPVALPRVIEVLHAGSLIVDDVQDGSEQRRGAPALHRIVGEPLAINTGSWMYFWALGELARLAIPGAVERAVIALGRCHQGQALDLSTRITDVPMRDVAKLVATTTRLKTGVLCRLAMELGGLAAGASPERLLQIGALGEAAGIALQMLDDLGCLVASERRAKACEDLVACRPTWAWAWLAEVADLPTYLRHASAARAIASAPDRATATARAEQLAVELVREIEPLARARVSAAIDAAIVNARGLPAPALAELAAMLHDMESRYG